MKKVRPFILHIDHGGSADRLDLFLIDGFFKGFIGNVVECVGFDAFPVIFFDEAIGTFPLRNPLISMEGAAFLYAASK